MNPATGTSGVAGWPAPATEAALRRPSGPEARHPSPLPPTHGETRTAAPGETEGGRQSGAERPAPAGRGRERPARLDLRYHAESERWMVVVRDAATGRVLATIPPEELLETIGRIRRMLGLLVDETA